MLQSLPWERRFLIFFAKLMRDGGHPYFQSAVNCIATAPPDYEINETDTGNPPPPVVDLFRYFKLPKGRALLYGPGSIHHAHSRIEKIGVTELKDAVEAYKRIAKSCLGRPPL